MTDPIPSDPLEASGPTGVMRAQTVCGNTCASTGLDASSSDRELLELAARAFGFQVRGWVRDQLHCFDPIIDDVIRANAQSGYLSPIALSIYRG